MSDSTQGQRISSDTVDNEEGLGSSLGARLAWLKVRVASHLLSLDSQKSSGKAKWRPSLQGIRISDALQGINITPNISFLLLFVGFFLWLFVIYWVRHNEPLANQVLGTAKDHAPTAHEDRQLVAGIKKTLPVRTSHNTGDFFVPQGLSGRNPGGGQGSAPTSTLSRPPAPETSIVPNPVQPSFAMHPTALFPAGVHSAVPSNIHPAHQLPSWHTGRPNGAVSLPPNLHPSPMSSPFHGGNHLPQGYAVTSPYGAGYPHPGMPSAVTSPPAVYPVPTPIGRSSQGTSYEVGLHTSSGPKVKTIVNR